MNTSLLRFVALTSILAVSTAVPAFAEVASRMDDESSSMRAVDTGVVNDPNIGDRNSNNRNRNDRNQGIVRIAAADTETANTHTIRGGDRNLLAEADSAKADAEAALVLVRKKSWNRKERERELVAFA